MSKIVYLIEQTFDRRNYERFGIAIWLEHGWRVEVWNLTPLSSPQVWRSISESQNATRPFAGSFVLSSERDLAERCAGSDPIDCFVDLTGHNRWTVKAKRRLARLGAIRIVGQLGSIPDYDSPRAGGALARMRKRLAALVSVTTKLAAKWYGWYVEHFIPPGLVIVAGRKSYEAALRGGHGERILAAHNLDYDLFLELRGRLPGATTSSRPYAVFLDQNICFHPEFAFENLTPYVTAGRYFPTVCRGLRAMGTALGLDVRIAAHPRATYAQHQTDYFEGIPVESNRTAELIRNCAVVVCHSSTALQFAVLFEKPVVFTTTDELAASLLGEYVAKFARVLGKSVVNLDTDLSRVDWRNELRIDVSAYARYRDIYVKMEGTEDRPLWELVVTRLEGDACRQSALPAPSRAEETLVPRL